MWHSRCELLLSVTYKYFLVSISKLCPCTGTLAMPWCFIHFYLKWNDFSSLLAHERTSSLTFREGVGSTNVPKRGSLVSSTFFRSWKPALFFPLGGWWICPSESGEAPSFLAPRRAFLFFTFTNAFHFCHEAKNGKCIRGPRNYNNLCA